ncbi:hypothetical protein SPI_04222 [Niveomyces insectorum RCEF 264]|uniref:DUF6590 domain-containing protein n=1 Tax=Niveomyces insectorum RCEF 264 TaxID=1081102 RepID=A0A162J232_9HYPO|nr:hypothetical protein SPI_04222 [Niveomyces insectorum RCEF 264]
MGPPSNGHDSQPLANGNGRLDVRKTQRFNPYPVRRDKTGSNSSSHPDHGSGNGDGDHNVKRDGDDRSHHDPNGDNQNKIHDHNHKCNECSYNHNGSSDHSCQTNNGYGSDGKFQGPTDGQQKGDEHPDTGAGARCSNASDSHRQTKMTEAAAPPTMKPADNDARREGCSQARQERPPERSLKEKPKTTDVKTPGKVQGESSKKTNPSKRTPAGRTAPPARSLRPARNPNPPDRQPSHAGYRIAKTAAPAAGQRSKPRVAPRQEKLQKKEAAIVRGLANAIHIAELAEKNSPYNVGDDYDSDADSDYEWDEDRDNTDSSEDGEGIDEDEIRDLVELATGEKKMALPPAPKGEGVDSRKDEPMEEPVDAPVEAPPADAADAKTPVFTRIPKDPRLAQSASTAYGRRDDREDDARRYAPGAITGLIARYNGQRDNWGGRDNRGDRNKSADLHNQSTSDTGRSGRTYPSSSNTEYSDHRSLPDPGRADSSRADNSCADDSHADNNHADNTQAGYRCADDKPADNNRVDYRGGSHNYTDNSHADNSHADNNQAGYRCADDKNADNNQVRRADTYRPNYGSDQHRADYRPNQQYDDYRRADDYRADYGSDQYRADYRAGQHYDDYRNDQRYDDYRTDPHRADYGGQHNGGGDWSQQLATAFKHRNLKHMWFNGMSLVALRASDRIVTQMLLVPGLLISTAHHTHSNEGGVSMGTEAAAAAEAARRVRLPFDDPYRTATAFGVVHSKYRKFVVLKVFEKSMACVPIYTHQGLGLQYKPNKNQHMHIRDKQSAEEARWRVAFAEAADMTGNGYVTALMNHREGQNRSKKRPFLRPESFIALTELVHVRFDTPITHEGCLALGDINRLQSVVRSFF